MKDAYGRPANRGPANQINSAPREMFLPPMFPRVKQLGDYPGLRVDAGQVRAFVQIAIYASKSNIAQIIAATVAPRNDMLNVERCQWGIILVHFAVFATIVRAASSIGSVRRRHRLRFLPTS